MPTKRPSHAAPSVVLSRLPDRPVVFDFDRLVAIEEATGLGINDVCDALKSCLGNQEKGVPPKLSLKFVRGFVAGCTDIPQTEIAKTFGVGVKGAFNELVPGFVEAISQLSGAEDESGPPAAAGSGANAPGPASTSESAPSSLGA